jgi:hypothetical protein
MRRSGHARHGDDGQDEFYRDILEDGDTPSAFQRDVLTTMSRHDEPALAEALNKNQMASKMWLADSLFDTVGRDLGNVVVLGGWFGVLRSHTTRFTIARYEPRHRSALCRCRGTHDACRAGSSWR